MSNEHSDPGHGDSPAAWTAVAIMLIGFALGTLAFFLEWYPVVWASVGVIALGLVVGFVMRKAGYGVGGHRYIGKSHS